ncbi:MAG: ATP-binding protein [Bacteroidota bacterium]
MARLSLRLRVRGDTAELARVRQRVAQWASAAGLTEAAKRKAQLAVDETVANAIEHGLPDGHVITVMGTLGQRRLVVTVRYQGAGFDPTTAPTGSADEALRQRAEHGYGLHLIRALADDVAYRRDGTVNEVRLAVGGER